MENELACLASAEWPGRRPAKATLGGPITGAFASRSPSMRRSSISSMSALWSMSFGAATVSLSTASSAISRSGTGRICMVRWALAGILLQCGGCAMLLEVPPACLGLSISCSAASTVSSSAISASASSSDTLKLVGDEDLLDERLRSGPELRPGESAPPELRPELITARADRARRDGAKLYHCRPAAASTGVGVGVGVSWRRKPPNSMQPSELRPTSMSLPAVLRPTSMSLPALDGGPDGGPGGSEGRCRDVAEEESESSEFLAGDWCRWICRASCARSREMQRLARSRKMRLR